MDTGSWSEPERREPGGREAAALPLTHKLGASGPVNKPLMKKRHNSTYLTGLHPAKSQCKHGQLWPSCWAVTAGTEITGGVAAGFL